MEIDKQGVELEMNIIPKNGNPLVRNESVHHYATERFQTIFNLVYYDDHKPEFPSKPCATLGSLEDELSLYITEFIKEAEKEKWYLLLLGNYPFYRDFCSGHIHTSFTSKEHDWLYFRKKLYNAQPLIAYLSANSPIVEGEYMASDVRLSLSTWSEFTEYDDKSLDHWTALAYGNRGATLECRIPSAGPLFQILGIAAVLRHLIENEEEDLPNMYSYEIWRNVVLYGSKAIIPVYLPKKITYYGYKTRKVYVRAPDLFGMYIQENLSSLKEIISSCSIPVQKEILQFYDLASKGITLSDIVLNIWFSLSDKIEITKFISDLTETSYSKGQIINNLPLPNSNINLEPVSPKPLTFEEFKELINSLDLTPLQNEVINELSMIMLQNYFQVESMVKFMEQRVPIPDSYKNLVNTLQDLKVIKATLNPPYWAPGDNYLYFKQLVESFNEHI